jgi:hypothetical protein
MSVTALRPWRFLVSLRGPWAVRSVLDQINKQLDREAVRQHDRLGRAIGGGEQFERAAGAWLGLRGWTLSVRLLRRQLVCKLRPFLFDHGSLGQGLWPRDKQTPEALAAQQKAEIEKWWPIIKAANIKAE